MGLRWDLIGEQWRRGAAQGMQQGSAGAQQGIASQLRRQEAEAEFARNKPMFDMELERGKVDIAGRELANKRSEGQYELEQATQEDKIAASGLNLKQQEQAVARNDIDNRFLEQTFGDRAEKVFVDLQRAKTKAEQDQVILDNLPTDLKLSQDQKRALIQQIYANIRRSDADTNQTNVKTSALLRSSQPKSYAVTGAPEDLFQAAAARAKDVGGNSAVGKVAESADNITRTTQFIKRFDENMNKIADYFANNGKAYRVLKEYLGTKGLRWSQILDQWKAGEGALYKLAEGDAAFREVVGELMLMGRNIAKAEPNSIFSQKILEDMFQISSTGDLSQLAASRNQILGRVRAGLEENVRSMAKWLPKEEREKQTAAVMQKLFGSTRLPTNTKQADNMKKHKAGFDFKPTGLKVNLGGR